MTLRAQLGPTVRSVEAIRSIVGVPRPASVRDILVRYREPIVFDEPLVTADGVALGGHHTVTLERNGGFRHQGHMRATGFPSFTYGVRTVLANEAGVPAVVAASGRVHGTNEVGDRESSWDQTGREGLVEWHWASMKQARSETSINHDADFFGTVGDVLSFAGTLAAGGIVAGPAGVYLMLGIHAADAAGLDEGVGVGGLAGVAVAGGVLVIFGPTAIVPALVAGAAAGIAVEAAIRHSPMSDAQRAFAERVFGPTLPIDRITLTNMLGLGRRPFTIPSVGDTILVNLGAGFDDPENYDGFGDSENPNRQAPGQLFIHELAHAWQIEHATFLPGLICDAISTSSTTVGGDMGVYQYGDAGPNYADFNPEQQASIIDDWFAGSGKQGAFGFGPIEEADPSIDENLNPYFRYIRDNIRNRIP